MMMMNCFFRMNGRLKKVCSQLTFTGSKSSTETQEKGAKCSKLTTKTPERGQSLRSGVYIINFEQIPHLFLVFLLLTLNK